MSDDLNLLLRQIKLRRYREGSPERILADLYEDLIHSGHGHHGWDLIVELIADRYREIELKRHGITLLPKTKHQDLAEKYREEIEHYIAAAQRKPWDYLGEVFIKNNLGNPSLGQNLTPKNVVDLIVQMTLGDEKEIKKTKTVLDPCVGTGRFLLEASLLYPKAPLLLYGIEIDVSLYRACVVNLSMFSRHPFSIICGDSLRLDTRLCGPASPLWLLGNQWDPPDISKFYVKPPAATEKKFSLSGWIKEAETATGREAQPP